MDDYVVGHLPTPREMICTYVEAINHIIEEEVWSFDPGRIIFIIIDRHCVFENLYEPQFYWWCIAIYKTLGEKGIRCFYSRIRYALRSGKGLIINSFGEKKACKVAKWDPELICKEVTKLLLDEDVCPYSLCLNLVDEFEKLTKEFPK